MKTKNQIIEELKTKDQILTFTNREWNRAAWRSRIRVRNASWRTAHPSDRKSQINVSWFKLSRSFKLNTRKDLLTTKK